MAVIVPIPDFESPVLDVYARLTENQLVCRENPEAGLFIAESVLVIERALDAGFVPVSFLVDFLRRRSRCCPAARRSFPSIRRSCRFWKS